MMRIKTEIRSWNLNRRLQIGIEQIAKNIGPKVRGWLNYYSPFGRTEIRKVMKYLNQTLTKWVMRKYKRFARNRKLGHAYDWLVRRASYDRSLFVHWAEGYVPYPRLYKLK